MRIADLYRSNTPAVPMPPYNEKLSELKRLFALAKIESDPFQFVRDNQETYVGTGELLQIWYKAHRGESFPWDEE